MTLHNSVSQQILYSIKRSMKMKNEFTAGHIIEKVIAL